jgi:hypothetical protein
MMSYFDFVPRLSCTRSARVAPLFFATLLLACVQQSTANLGSMHVKSQRISALTGGTIEVTTADQQAHPTPSIAGTKIEIPAGALDTDTTITVDLGPASIMPAKAHTVGPAVELGPTPHTFSKPVTVSIPYQSDIHAKRLRIFTLEPSGARSVLRGSDLTLDRDKKLVQFQTTHFTSFQCGEDDPEPCDVGECGPALGLPNWVCEDGSLGGPTGDCERDDDGNCAWGVNWCPVACDPMACGPVPALQLMCPGGAMAVPVCGRLANGACGWDLRCPNHCEPPDPTTPGMPPPGSPPPGGGMGGGPGMPPPPNVCRADCSHGRPCPMGTSCDPNTGDCVPNHVPCGPNHACGAGEYCCNESCGICAPLGAACPAIACQPCGGMGHMGGCPPGTRCEPNHGCVPDGTQCGMHTCPMGQYCCNDSCGICAPMGAACPQIACADCNDPAGHGCPPGTQCDGHGRCTPSCGPMDCGPPLGLPNWICEDGSRGGPTGRCLPAPGMGMGMGSGMGSGMGGGPNPGRDGGMGPPPPHASACGWEVNWCPRRCEPQECGPRPGITNHVCPDGTMAGPTGRCRRAQNGACSWEIVHCPM